MPFGLPSLCTIYAPTWTLSGGKGLKAFRGFKGLGAIGATGFRALGSRV